jgi:hypothetical protein
VRQSEKKKSSAKKGKMEGKKKELTFGGTIERHNNSAADETGKRGNTNSRRRAHIDCKPHAAAADGNSTLVGSNGQQHRYVGTAAMRDSACRPGDTMTAQ